MMDATPQFGPTDTLTVTLEAQEWNIVFAGLRELPYRVCVDVINKMHMQLAQGQVNVSQQD